MGEGVTRFLKGHSNYMGGAETGRIKDVSSSITEVSREDKVFVPKTVYSVRSVRGQWHATRGVRKGSKMLCICGKKVTPFSVKARTILVECSECLVYVDRV